jgi:hypothetical protein
MPIPSRQGGLRGLQQVADDLVAELLAEHLKRVGQLVRLVDWHWQRGDQEGLDEALDQLVVVLGIHGQAPPGTALGVTGADSKEAPTPPPPPNPE